MKQRGTGKEREREKTGIYLISTNINYIFWIFIINIMYYITMVANNKAEIKKKIQ